jgi:hypothetical protein
MKTYKSKFGYRFVGFVTLILGLIMGILVIKNEPMRVFLSVGVISIVVYTVILYLNFSTIYIIDQGILTVKCGIFYHKRFDISKIKSISKTGNIIASPAPSMDRIALTYGVYDVIILSPKNKMEFTQELTRINPVIENKLLG